MLTRVLTMLPAPRLEEAVISRVDAVLPQCNLSELSSLAQAIIRWLRGDPTYRHSAPGVHSHLLQVLNRCGLERVHMADRLDLLLEELKYVSGEWFEEMLLDETMLTLQRLMDQISVSNLPEICLFLTKTNCAFAPILDRIASITKENIHKVPFRKRATSTPD